MLPAIVLIAGIVLSILFILILLLAFWVWAIIDCLLAKRSVAEKLFWLLIIMVLNVIGALLYLLISKKKKVVIVKTKDFKGKRLFRSKKNRVIAGICGGVGEYLTVDPVVVRLVWVLITILTGGLPGIVAYAVAWIIVPEKK